MAPRLVNRVPSLRVPSQPALTRTQDAITQVLNPMATALQNTPMMGSPAPAWISATFNDASWVNAGGTGANAFATAQFHLDALNYVHVKGVVKTSIARAAASTIFVLPSGYGPKETHVIAAWDLTAGAATAFTVFPSGVIQSPIIAINHVLSLGDLVFLAEGGGTGGVGPATGGHIGPSPHG